MLTAKRIIDPRNCFPVPSSFHGKVFIFTRILFLTIMLFHFLFIFLFFKIIML